MATQFKVWIDSPDDTTSGNVMSQSDFATDSQRTSGYASGQTLSSKRLNTILRQTSLIMVALMDQFCPSSTATLMSSLATVKTALGNAIATKSSVTELSAIVASQGNHISTLQNTVDNFIGSSPETIPAVAERVTNIENGTTIVPYATNAINALDATNDVDGDAIKSKYGASLNVSNATITLKAKDGTQLSSKTINNVANAAQATQASKLGASNVGTSKKFIYLVGGTPTATSDDIGSATKPIYMRNGELRALTGNVGNSNTPVYMTAGAIASTGKDLRKMMNDLDINMYDHLIFGFGTIPTYTWTQIQGDVFYNAINSIFENYPDGIYPVSMYEMPVSGYEKRYFTGTLSKTLTTDGTESARRYNLNIKSLMDLDEYQVEIVKYLQSDRASIRCARVMWGFYNIPVTIGSLVNSYVDTIYVTTDTPGKATEKSISWERNI